jgi:anti-sigma B factor antagonist
LAGPVSAVLVATLLASSITGQKRSKNQGTPKPAPCQINSVTHQSTTLGETLKEEEATTTPKLHLKIPELHINERHAGDVTILDLAGDMEGLANFTLRLRIDCQLEQGHKKIVLNLKDVKEIDEVGLYELNVSGLMLMRNEGKLKLLNLTTGVKDLLMISKLLTVFDVYDNESEAVNSFR